MRLPSVVVIAACLAGVATAASAEDRFGPSPAAAATAAEAHATPTPLGWSGKMTVQQAAVNTPRDLPQPLANGLLRNTSVLSSGRLRIAPSVVPAQQPVLRGAPAPQPVAQAAPRPVPVVAPTPAPQAVAVAPAPWETAPAKVALAGGPPEAAPPAPPVAQAGQLTAPLPSTLFEGAPAPVEASPSTSAITRARFAANAANTGATGQATPRLYSVHSGYGMVPDPIPLDQTGVGQVDVVQSGGVQ